MWRGRFVVRFASKRVRLDAERSNPNQQRSQRRTKREQATSTSSKRQCQCQHSPPNQRHYRSRHKHPHHNTTATTHIIVAATERASTTTRTRPPTAPSAAIWRCELAAALSFSAPIMRWRPTCRKQRNVVRRSVPRWWVDVPNHVQCTNKWRRCTCLPKRGVGVCDAAKTTRVRHQAEQGTPLQLANEPTCNGS